MDCGERDWRSLHEQLDASRREKSSHVADCDSGRATLLDVAARHGLSTGRTRAARSARKQQKKHNLRRTAKERRGVPKWPF
jgi:hypothetical protein